MDTFMQRLVERFHDHLFSILPSSSRTPGKLAVVNSFAQKKRMEVNKENESGISNVKALTFKISKTKSDNSQESNENMTRTGTASSSYVNENVESCGKGKLSEKKTNMNSVRNKIWRIFSNDTDTTMSVRGDENSKFYKENKNCSAVKIHRSSESNREMEEHTTDTILDIETDSVHLLEFSNYIQNTPSISSSSLLEEIEADLPSSCSLANILDYTFHTVNNARTSARLSRVGISLAPAEILPDKIENIELNLKNKLKYLQKEAFIQKTLIDQAHKIVKLCRIRKKNMEYEDVESIKVLLLAKLRYQVLNMEIQKIRLSGGESREENFGELSMTDIFFTLNELQNYEAGYFICILYQKEELFASNVKREIINGKLHFSVDFKFQQLEHNFIIHLELYRIICKSKSKEKQMKIFDIKNAIKSATHFKSKNSNNQNDEHCFNCIGSASLRLDDVKSRQMGKVSISFHTGFDASFRKTISVYLRTRVFLNQKLTGFLNMFKNRCWYRLWCCQIDYSIHFWNYPEDKENEKKPFESVYLPCCSDVNQVTMDVCIRPHTFTLIFKDSSSNVLLSAGSQKDMMNWINHLRSCIQYFQAWNPDF